jgi:prepilin-type N-terminal cleavage/methylation domain-containing protein
MTAIASARERRPQAGYTLIELLAAMGISTLVMTAAMAGLGEAMRTNQAILQITSMNTAARAAVDLMTRDLLQAGAGLPKGQVVLIPFGGSRIRLPGPPGSAFLTNSADLNLPAVLPGAERGPTVDGVTTDVVTFLTADNTFVDVGLTAVSGVSVNVEPSVQIATGPDRVRPGDLVMVLKGSASTLVQVTAVDPGARRLSFATGDSLQLNQTGTGMVGNLAALNAHPPSGGAAAAATRITRVRMISYYLDDLTSPGRPRLVRRINNGHPTTFDNTLGTALALDVENLRFTYDLNDGDTNPADVRFLPDDVAGTGRCAPSPCAPTQIRKVNVLLTVRSEGQTAGSHTYRNTLSTQVALRGMALKNKYQ